MIQNPRFIKQKKTNKLKGHPKKNTEFCIFDTSATNRKLVELFFLFFFITNHAQLEHVIKKNNGT